MKAIKKYSVLLFIFLICFYIAIFKINAATAAYITGNYVQVRTGSGTNNTSIASLSKNTEVSLVSTTKYTGTGCDAGWYQINYSGNVRYVCSTYVALGSVNTNISYNTANWDARVYATSVTVRKSATSSSSSVDSALLGTNLNILSKESSGSGCSTNWYKVSYNDNKTGYICGTYITFKSSVTASDSAYEKTLSDAGFPSDYIPYLVYLHKIHPTWTFKAIKTNLSWNDVISNESGKNYMQTSISAYRTSSSPAEGSTWFYATDGIIAFFMDPRNFLTEKFIFQFEDLGYDTNIASSYPGAVKEVLSGGKFANDTYAGYITNAGKNKNVSPIHLASRIRQEVGLNGGDGTGGGSFTWNSKTYSGYYNFFNIGAYGDNPLRRGLAYAAGLLGNTSYGVPWNTPEKAINGGADFLSSGYISKGQYTLYFQKFNTSPTSSSAKYTHQYMTNVQAPTSEGSTSYYSYSDMSLLNTSLVFAIPIYNNMPSYTSLPVIGNTNNSLSSIIINGQLLSDFDTDVLSYAYYVSKTTNSITLSATASSSTSTVDYDSTINLTDDINEITISVTSQTGSTKTYKVTVYKIQEVQTLSEVVSKANIKMTNAIVYTISPSTTVSTFIQSIKRVSPNAVITVKNPSGTALSNSSYLTTNSTITIRTIGNETGTYTFAINGDTSGDGKVTILDLLQVQKHILGSSNLKDSKFLAGDTSRDGKITILDLLQVQKHILGSKKL